MRSLNTPWDYLGQSHGVFKDLRSPSRACYRDQGEWECDAANSRRSLDSWPNNGRFMAAGGEIIKTLRLLCAKQANPNLPSTYFVATNCPTIYSTDLPCSSVRLSELMATDDGDPSVGSTPPPLFCYPQREIHTHTPLICFSPHLVGVCQQRVMASWFGRWFRFAYSLLSFWRARLRRTELAVNCWKGSLASS